MIVAICPAIGCVTNVTTKVHCDHTLRGTLHALPESHIRAGVAMKDKKKNHSDDRSNKKNVKQKYDEPNPPRTTTDGITAPKFGSAGSGGAELEPGPERD